jgi:cytochrome c556
MKFTPAALSGLAAALAAAAALGSCSKPAPKTEFDTTLPMAEVMGHVVDHAAFTFWRSSGEVVTEKGTESLLPKTEEGWLAAESGAATVHEAGNLLLIPNRIADQRDKDWPKYVKAMQAVALKARDAAARHDGEAMFSTGADLYQTCVACHEKYVIPAAIAANREVVDKARLTDFPEDVRAKIAAYNKAHPIS